MSAYSKKTTTRQANRFRPEVQALEDRQLLSVTSTFDGVTLTLKGDGDRDFVSVIHDGNGRVTVEATGIAKFDQIGVSKVVIDTGGKRDTVRFTQTGNLSRNFDLEVFLGGDADNFIANVLADINAFRTMNIDVHGGGGSDLITVDASGDADVQAGGRLLVDMETDSGDTDKMAFAYRGELDGLLDIDMVANGGANRLSAEIVLDAFSTGQVGGGDGDGGSRMDAGRGDDQLRFVISDDQFGVSVDAEMDGGRGMDVGTRTRNVRASGLERNNIVNFRTNNIVNVPVTAPASGLRARA